MYDKGLLTRSVHRISVVLSLLIVFFFVVSVNGAYARKPYKIKVLTPPAFMATYAIGVGLADVINKNSTWLKATVVEGKSPTENTKRVVAKKKLRKTVIWSITEPTHYEALSGFPIFKGINYDFTRIKYVFPISVILNALITLDPKIKTLADLKGKRICVINRPTRTAWSDMAFYCLEAAGVSRDDVKMEYMHYKPAHTAMMDGLLDVVGSGGAMMGPNKWVLSPFAVEVVDTRKTYFINWDAKVLERMYKETGNPYYPLTIPANTFRNQVNPWVIAAKYYAWSVTDEMPDYVVEEILRVVWENLDKFGEYHPMGKFLSPKTMGIMGNTKFYHPLAVKILKEKGSPMGVLR
ncbi:MAG: TAXI family TRAP transporter solute-binding subunit [Deltaproteobacteria bacterium]|nr:TAXI family TRAP transporter solute-binding subunit [Deltaproteobacteria bacterium]